MSVNKRIAKNTIFLYFRMLLTMFVSLYTSRVILEILGVDDFGIYQVVGGIVALLSFINGAISTGSARFLTFELGTGDFSRLKRTFSTTLTAHIILAIIVLVLAETVGLWFVLNKLVIPDERMHAALWVYQFSVLTALINITQVPYTASIIAHEKMSIYAYVSILEVSLKLGVVYLLILFQFDRLIIYSILLFVTQMIISVFYRFYSVFKFKETKFRFGIDKEIFKTVFGFSGWSLFASGSIALNEQGTTILTNLFFGPSVVAARAISTQVNMAANQLVTNFKVAVDPQIVKRLASGDIESSKSLLLASTKYSFYLMFLLGFPIILLAEPILYLWLKEVPDYTVLFLQLVIIQSFFSVFDSSFYTALYAKGKLKQNALISPIIGFIRFPIVYLLFKNGYSPVAMSYVGIATYALLGLLIKPILICKIADYNLKEIFSVFSSCLKVCFISVPLSLLSNYYIVKSTFGYLAIGFLSLCFTLTSIYLVGIDKQIRCQVTTYFKRIILKI